MNLQSLHKAVRGEVLLADPEFIDVVVASVVGNRSDGIPIWIMFTGPPSTLKTEILSALDGLRDLYLVDKFTPKAFLSAIPGASLAEQLMEEQRRSLVMLDFGSVLCLRRDDKADILHSFRQLYDGKFSARTGMKKSRITWRGKIGLLGGATEAIDMEQVTMGQLGPRFLMMRLIPPSRRGAAAAARRNVHRARALKDNLKHAFHTFLGRAFLEPSKVHVPDDIDIQMNALADIAAWGRSAVFRDQNGAIVGTTGTEGPGRIGMQLEMLLCCLAVIRGRDYATEDDFATVRRVGLESMPVDRFQILRLLFNRPMLVGEIAKSTFLSESTIRRKLEELRFLGLTVRDGDNYHRLTTDPADAMSIVYNNLQEFGQFCPI